jgi:hypothetical protein
MAYDYNSQDLDQENYISYIEYKFKLMKELLPDNVRFIDIMKCMAKAWKKHKDFNIDIQYAMHNIKDEFINSIDI